jgi:hypothetical protein
VIDLPGAVEQNAAPGFRRMRDIKFTYSRTRSGRKHYLNEGDVRILLSRLPDEVWQRLREVHFNDRARGFRVAGYVNMGRRDIAICAMPFRVSMTKFLAHPRSTLNRLRRSPHEYGAIRGRQWPELAVRRFMLYDVFLHELGHLQIVNPNATRVKRMFASESKAQEFADCWRTWLWSKWFDHSDPVHNRATGEELEQQNKIRM